MAITQEVNIEMLEKLPDGNYKKKNPQTKASQVIANNGQTVEQHLAEKATLTTEGHVQLSNATNSTSNALAATPSAVKSAMDRANEAFTSASNGKTLVGNAITGVDDSVVIPADPTFQELASAIGGMSLGRKYASGTYKHAGTGSQGSIRGLDFIPSVVVSVNKSDTTGRAFRWMFAPGETVQAGTYTSVSLIEGVYGFDWQHIGSLGSNGTFTWLAIE